MTHSTTDGFLLLRYFILFYSSLLQHYVAIALPV